MDEKICIKHLDKADVLAALYNQSRAQGMGLLHYTSATMTRDEAAEILEQKDGRLYFDYLKGRVMKVDLSGDELSPALYDRDNGAGAAASAISLAENED